MGGKKKSMKGFSSTGGGCIPASESVMTARSKSDTFTDAVHLLCGALTLTG